jgi:CheY-like chemotaxis protein
MKNFADTLMTTAIKRPAGQETILLVEDDPVMREMVSEILCQSGYRVLTAASAPQALKTWEKFARLIDLVLTDVLLPYRSTGLELARKFQESKPKLKIVFTSGFGPEICAGDPAMASGWFLPKPFSQTALLRIISNCLKAGVSSSETCHVAESELYPLPK